MATYKISGTTAENGSPAANLIVAYKADRTDVNTMGDELGRTTSSGAGTWEITFEDWTSNVFVVAMDPTTEIKYKAKIKDWVLGVLQAEAGLGEATPVLADASFDSVLTLYHFEEADVPSLVNEAKPTVAVDIDFFNLPTLGSTGPKVGSKRLNFDTGSHAEIRTQLSSGTAWGAEGAADFTIEGWFLITAAGPIIRSGASGAGSSTGSEPLNRAGLQIQVEADGSIRVLAGNLGSYGASKYLNLDTAAAVVTFDQWFYFAMVSDNQIPYLFIDGVEQTLSLFSGTYPATDFTTIALWNNVPFNINATSKDNDGPSSSLLVGSSVVNNNVTAIDEFRLTKGAGRYTANFTPPTLPFTRFVSGLEATILDAYFDNVISLLHFEGVLDDVAGLTWTSVNSAYETASPIMGTSSLDLTPASAYIHAAGTDLSAIGTGDFTIEFILDNAGSTGAHRNYFDCRNGANKGLAIVGYNGETVLKINNSVGTVLTGTTNVHDGLPHNVCLMRDAGILYLIVDGTVDVSVALTDDWDHTCTMAIGATSAFAQPVNCLIDEFRFSAVARYPGAYTPSVIPFPDFEYDPVEHLGVYPVDVDPFFSDVVSLLHFDGGDGTTTITDEIGLTWSVVGDSQIDADNKKYGTGALLLDGTGDYIGQGVSGDWNFLHDGTTDYTVEMWVNPVSVSTAYETLFDTGGAASAGRGMSLAIRGDTTSILEWTISKGTGGGSYSMVLASSFSMTAGVWQHVAACLYQGTAYLYIDGVLAGTGTPVSPSASNSTSALSIGRWASGNIYYANASIDDVRVTTAGRYTGGNFTPPTEALPDSRFRDNLAPPILDSDWASNIVVLAMDSANSAVFKNEVANTYHSANGSAIQTVAEFKYGTAAGEFLTDPDYLLLPYDPAFDIGDELFTMEGWVYIIGSHSPDYPCFFSLGPTAGGDTGLRWSFAMSPSNQLTFNVYNSAGNNWLNPIADAGTVPTGAWAHVAVVRDGAGVDGIKMYIDGVLVSTSTSNPSLNTNANGTPDGIIVGGNSISAMNAYLDDMRITKGIARYTGAFTPPTSAVPPFEYNPSHLFVATEVDPYFDNVHLLMPFEVGVTTNLTGLASLTFTNNGAIVPTAGGKFGNAAEFDGSTQYLVSTAAPADWSFLHDGTETYTLDMWLKIDVISDRCILTTNELSLNATGIYLYLNGSGTVAFAISKGAAPAAAIMTSTATLVAGTFSFIRVTVDSATGVVKLFIDGTEEGTDTLSGQVASAPSTSLRIGRWATNTLYQMDGMIDDFRITKGVVRDGAEVPVAALPTSQYTYA